MNNKGIMSGLVNGDGSPVKELTQGSKFLPIQLNEFLNQEEFDALRLTLKDVIKDKEKVEAKLALYKMLEGILSKLPEEK